MEVALSGEERTWGMLAIYKEGRTFLCPVHWILFVTSTNEVRFDLHLKMGGQLGRELS